MDIQREQVEKKLADLRIEFSNLMNQAQQYRKLAKQTQANAEATFGAMQMLEKLLEEDKDKPPLITVAGE